MKNMSLERMHEMETQLLVSKEDLVKYHLEEEVINPSFVGIMALWTCVELDSNPLTDGHLSYIHIDWDKKRQEEIRGDKRGHLHMFISQRSNFQNHGAIGILSEQ